MRRMAIPFALAIVASSCVQPQVATSAIDPPPATIQVTRSASPQIPLAETSDPNEQNIQRTPPQYDLAVLFDYSEHSLQVHERVTFWNDSSDSIAELQLVVEAHRSGAGFFLTDLRVNEETQTGEYELSDGILHIPMLDPLAPGETVRLEIEYELVLPAGAGTLTWTDRQVNFIDWYPYFPPYLNGQGWLVHQPAAVGEHSVFESANFRVNIEVFNAPASLQIAAPAPREGSGATFDYELRNARRFAWSASGQYEVLETEFEEVPVSIYYFSEHRDAAKASLATAKQALETYSALFGAYPYESLAIVDAQFFDGMESDAIFFLDRSYFLEYNYSPRNYLTALTAHEVAHNWWFGQVGNDQALEPWLDEALCIYSESLYYENTYPEMTDWWWEFRIDRFRPTGSVNSTIFDHASFDPYVQAVYMRGAQFIQRLRNAMGDAAFFEFLRAYASAGSGKIVSAHDLFRLMKYYGSTNLEPIITEFFGAQ